MPLYTPNPIYYPIMTDRAGFLAESINAAYISGSTVVPTAGRLELVKLKLAQSASVTNIVMHVATVGNTLTSGQCFAVLYTGAGTRVGVTATQDVAWVSLGVKTMALASGPFACAAGDYYVGFWFNGTTGPALARQGALANTMTNIGLSSPSFLSATADTGLTTTSPPTIGAMTSAANVWYAALT